MQGKLLPTTLRTFGDRLRWARKQKHLSQGRVATHCGAETHAAVGNWERGHNFPGLENLVPAAELLDVSLDWLVWGMGSGIDARLRKVPKVLRDGLIARIHEEIDKTLDAAARLPPEMLHDESIKDKDPRLQSWSTVNKRAPPAAKRPEKEKGPQ